MAELSVRKIARKRQTYIETYKHRWEKQMYTKATVGNNKHKVVAMSLLPSHRNVDKVTQSNGIHHA